jgi:RNA polymerase sigma factor (sigma-70 family)
MEPCPRVPPVEELLAHSGFVRRLARGLLGREADADDLAQEAMTAALVRPPPPAVDVRSWLAGVVRNLVRMKRRSERRRARHESRAEPRAAYPSPAETASRLESQRRVVEAVHRLGEPYRSAIVLRFLDDVSTRDIAERAGVPFETVRTRLKRGLALMRADLARDRTDWRSGVLLLAGLTPSVSVGVTVSGAAVIGGAVIMSKKVLVAVAVMALCGALFTVSILSVEPEMPPELAREGVSAAARGEEAERKDPRAELEIEDVARQREDEKPKPFSERVYLKFIRGHLVRVDEKYGGSATLTAWPLDARGKPIGRPARDLVTLQGRRRSTWKLEATTTAQIGGPYVLDLAPMKLHAIPRDKALLVVDHPFYMPVETRVSLWSHEDVDVTMRVAAVVQGRVESGPNRGIAGALVSLHRGKLGETLTAATEQVLTDKDGMYRLRSRIEGPHQIVAFAVGKRPAVVSCTLHLGSEAYAPILDVTEGPAIEGVVVGKYLRKHRALKHLGVRAVFKGKTFMLGKRSVFISNGRLENAEVIAPVGKESKFRLGGLARESYRLEVITIEGAMHSDAMTGAGEEIRAPRSGLKLGIDPAFLNVHISRYDRASGLLTLKVVNVATKRAISLPVVTDDRMTITVAPQTDYRVEVHLEGMKDPSIKLVRSPRMGGQDHVFISSPWPGGRATLALEFEVPDGAQAVRLAGIAIGTARDGGPLRVLEIEAIDGIFYLGTFPKGGWPLKIRPGASWWDPGGALLDKAIEVAIPSTGRVEKTVRLKAGGRARITVRGPDGNPLAAECAIWRLEREGEKQISPVFSFRTPSGWIRRKEKLAGAGTNEIESALPAGDYELDVSTKIHRLKRVRFQIAAGKTTVLDVKLKAN